MTGREIILGAWARFWAAGADGQCVWKTMELSAVAMARWRARAQHLLAFMKVLII